MLYNNKLEQRGNNKSTHRRAVFQTHLNIKKLGITGDFEAQILKKIVTIGHTPRSAFSIVTISVAPV
jgi:hypothetical protein